MTGHTQGVACGHNKTFIVITGNTSQVVIDVYDVNVA
jgi:hypothetical protein